MKKLLHLSAMLLCFSLAYGQCVIDYSVTQPGVSPPAGSVIDTQNQTVVLPPANVGQPYNAVLQFKVPADTGFGMATADIDYIKVINILGMPSGFTYSCTPMDCTFPGDSNGCAEMSGTPTMADSVELRVAIEYKLTISGSSAIIPDTLSGYYFVARGGSVGIAEEDNDISSRVFPNPAKEMATIEFNGKGEKTSLRIMDMSGRLVHEQHFVSEYGINRIPVDVKDLHSGVYIYQLSNGLKDISGKFSVGR